MDAKGRSNFGDLQKALSVKNYAAIRIYLFDLLYLNGEDLRNRPLKERKKLLLELMTQSGPPIFYSEDVKGQGTQFFTLACHSQLEGIVSKESSAPYSSGRSRIWCKSKCGHRQEFVIGGYTAGKGGRVSEFGALLLGVYERSHGKRKLRYVGRVGSGFNNKTLDEVKAKLLAHEAEASPFDVNSPKEKNLHWLTPDLVAEISFSEWTADKILRTPVFIAFREDKAGHEIVMEKALTHPKKILFSAEKITKQMIADYYDCVAPLMLPLIKNRPLTLVRCPHGGDRKCFYQKHPDPRNFSEDLKSFKVREKNHTNLYITLDSLLGLKRLVQMDAFEIHAWNCHYQTLMHPDQIVMDFDPDPSVTFQAVVEGCLEMKKILDKLKLKSFVKVSGGKGIHLHIPIMPLYTWEQIKAFAKALAQEMVRRRPKQFTATMSKRSRQGKIFLDYFRNDYGATAVAPYALRARQICAVALPLEWNELPKLKSADQFTLKKALLKIKARKADPWKNILKIKQRITLLDF